MFVMKLLWLFFLLPVGVLAQDDAKPVSGEYAGISGNPFFIKDWSDGVIRFTSGKVTDKFKMKFNPVQNRLLLQFNGNSFATETRIQEFVMYTKNKKDSFLFRKGYPKTERGDEETFYQVLETGSATLLRLATKDIVEEKELIDAKVSRHYQDVDIFYLLREGVMHKIDKDLNPVQNILADKKEELKNYITEQQLKMRTTDDLVKVVRKYNSWIN